MTWRDIPVHVKANEDWSEHIDVAMRLAKNFDARLTGLRTSQNAATIKQYLATNSEAALEAAARETALASETERRFRDALNANRLDGDWDAAEGNASEILMLAGRVHDVIVVKQTQEGVDEPGWYVPEACAVSSGSPTLVMPFEGSFPSIGERLLIAWNGSQQAAAAVHGAMPLIHCAKQVTVVIGRGEESLRSITRYPKLDIVGHLSRHAAEVSTWAFEAHDWEAGARMLDIADKTNSDLVVMGAYGHSAWRERFLGGATRHVLKHMTLPVFMAH
jgi:nucleotide-binding universal stress UspA family protein